MHLFIIGCWIEAILLIFSSEIIVSDSGVAKGGAAYPGCHHFEVTPFYDVNRTKKKTIYLTSLEMVSTLKWTKNYLKHFLKHLFRRMALIC